MRVLYACANTFVHGQLFLEVCMNAALDSVLQKPQARTKEDILWRFGAHCCALHQAPTNAGWERLKWLKLSKPGAPNS